MTVYAPFVSGLSTSQFPLPGLRKLELMDRKYECTFCKTITPSLLFSRSSDADFPSDHHVQPSPSNIVAAARAGAEKLEKGKKWYDGLTLPGTLDLDRFDYVDRKLSVVFEDEDLVSRPTRAAGSQADGQMEQTLLLLRFNCPAPDCGHMAVNWDALEKHTLGMHGKVICRVCRSSLSRFAHEQTLYPPHLLPLHDPSRLKKGQKPPRPKGEEVELVKTWDAPHPVCEASPATWLTPGEGLIDVVLQSGFLWSGRAVCSHAKEP
jgi:transcription elongation factor Elf1